MKNKYCKWCNFRHEDDGSKCVFDMDFSERFHCVREPTKMQFHCVLDPTKAQLRDAAEFEARVARKLAIPIVSDGRPCPWGESNLCICEGEGVWLGCEGSRLKWARLAVEKEMDG